MEEKRSVESLLAIKIASCNDEELIDLHRAYNEILNRQFSHLGQMTESGHVVFGPSGPDTPDLFKQLNFKRIEVENEIIKRGLVRG